MKYVMPSVARFSVTHTLTIIWIVFLTSCQQIETTASVHSNAQLNSQTASIIKAVSEQRIKAHVEFLADDTLKGRDTGSDGYLIAANYAASQFKQLGLTPAGNTKHEAMPSYFQPVALRKSTLVPESATLTYQNKPSGQTIEFNYPNDFFVSPSTQSESRFVSADLVFVGYGIQNEQLKIDDYSHLNVAGKIAVALYGRPAHLPSEAAAHIQSSQEKARVAALNGAVGLITLHTPQREKVRPYQDSVKMGYSSRYNWLDNNKPHGLPSSLKGFAYLDVEPATHLFENAEKTLKQIYHEIDEGIAPVGFPLQGKITIQQASIHEEVSSPNVIAVLEGSDPELKNEYVLFSAHLDHIGIKSLPDSISSKPNSHTEDIINNGALDNAVGSAILLETARVLSELTIKPKRSIAFILVTAEEQGLLGSSFYAHNPTLDKDAIVANINLDMPLILYPFSDVVAFGATHSTLEEAVSTAARHVNISQSPDPMPEQALFTRSDHYSFVQQGIPSVFLMTGFSSTDAEIEGGETFRHFLSTHYHAPSDEINLPIHWQAGKTFTQINALIGLEVANSMVKPQWKPDSFFGNTFSPAPE